MGLRINTNLASLTAQRYLFAAGRQVEKSFGRLASGLRIQRGADDAAGLAMSERMRMRVGSWSQVERNISDGFGLANFAESVYSEVGNKVARLRELAMSAMNGTLSNSDRSSLQQEVDQILEEIDRIGANTFYNGPSGVPIGNGTILRVPIQVGLNADEFVYVRLTEMSTTGLTLDTVDVTSEANAAASLTGIDFAIQRIARGRGKLGADQHVLTSAQNNASTMRINLQNATSRIRDVDVALETAELMRARILQETAVKVLAQANLQPGLVLELLS